jgi:hypothetical protein
MEYIEVQKSSAPRLCGVLATVSDFSAEGRYHLRTFLNNKVDNRKAAGWRKPVLAYWRTPKSLPFPHWLPETDKQIGRQGTFMTANREPSNQSFEIDREATVCSASRRFLLFFRAS